VDTYAEKIAAERTAKRVYGVKAIANDLQVRHVGVRTDTEIAADVVRALEAHVSVPTNQVTVTVREGWVTLEGSVDWIFQKEAVENSVQYLGGVRGIANQIKVIPKVSSADVSEKIEERHIFCFYSEWPPRRQSLCPQLAIHLKGGIKRCVIIR